MIKIGGKVYIIDLDNIETLLTQDVSLDEQEMEEIETVTNFDEHGALIGKQVITKSYIKGKELDMSKYELIRMLLEMVLTYDIEVDDSLGFDNFMKETSLPFRISFNTLINYKIIKEI